MPLSVSLLQGFQYEVAGESATVTLENGGRVTVLGGERLTVVNNTPFPEDHEQRRKVTVKFDSGDVGYILPRSLSAAPVGVEQHIAVVQSGAPAPAPVSSAPAPRITVDSEPEDRVHSVVVVNPITDPMDPRLDHLRPSRAKVRRYVNRIMKNGKTDMEFLLTFASDKRRAKNEGRPVNLALQGDTNSGKTFAIEALAVAWAESMGLPKPMPIWTLSGSAGVTDYDMFGMTQKYVDPVTGENSFVWLPGTIDSAARIGGILNVDEPNAIAERFTTSMHSVFDHRHQFKNRNKPVYFNGEFLPETVTVSLDMWGIITYNAGYRGMSKMNQAFHQRFMHVEWPYDEEVERKLIKSPGVLAIGKALRLARAGNEIQTPIGTAALQALADNVEDIGVDMAVDVLLAMFDPGEEKRTVEAILKERSFLSTLHDEVNTKSLVDDDIFAP